MRHGGAVAGGSTLFNLVVIIIKVKEVERLCCEQASHTYIKIVLCFFFIQSRDFFLLRIGLFHDKLN